MLKYQTQSTRLKTHWFSRLKEAQACQLIGDSRAPVKEAAYLKKKHQNAFKSLP